MPVTVLVELPRGLCHLSGAPQQFHITLDGLVTQRSILDTVEAIYPQLSGTIRDHTTAIRRPFLRFFVANQDLSHLAPDDPLPAILAEGNEPFLILGAIAGG